MKIYLVAPSFGCTTEPYKTRLEVSIKKLKELGFEIIEGHNVYLNDGICASNTPRNRAKEIEDAFNSDADIVLSVGGGELMCEILDYINFNNLPKKTFCGFSDNTNLTFTVTTILNYKSIYGANAPSFYDLSYSALDTYKMFLGKKQFQGYLKYELYPDKENPLAKLNLTEDKILTLYNYKKMEGIMLGGCLDCLITLCGTRFDRVSEYIKDKKIIWFLESCDLNLLAQRRALFQLKNAGWFDTACGFIIGRPLNYESIMGLDKINNIIDLLKEYNVPIILDADLGHLSPSLPFACGVKASVEVIENNIEINYLEDIIEV